MEIYKFKLFNKNEERIVKILFNLIQHERNEEFVPIKQLKYLIKLFVIMSYQSKIVIQYNNSGGEFGNYIFEGNL